ncbi:MAG: flagella basal body P-ring formation protein FlgA [Ignavibacteriae bacterium]|nr:MAG: flagella basal body P-ring formation protein FlgA [Ignavibacteriota bacterium]
MIYLLNILFSLIFLGDNSNSIDIQKLLTDKLPEYTKMEYNVLSPKDADLSNYLIDNSREVIVNKGYAYIPVINKITSGTRKNGTITLKIKLFKNVLVSTRSIRRNENISEHDFMVEEREISHLRFKPANISSSINHLRARRDIEENVILSNYMVELVPDVCRGDRVEAIFANKSVNISFMVTARTEGVAGEIIKVKRDDRRIFRATVLNNTTVKIIE